MPTSNLVSYTDPALCPLCQQENHCAVAAGKDPTSCWCMNTKIDEAAKLRANDGGSTKRCLCKTCGCPC
ncbi:cysteine-rich CWC family protein [Zhongshania sp. BJYM1]|uniref:cysteine-rich CWC family protein n=1 Tax=Zhongshania aquatica TaxID=2965069 RepID=UPI0022B4CDEF|nr:cysteine-rich CWC family protein [Marortus sp. BJYM1]